MDDGSDRCSCSEEKGSDTVSGSHQFDFATFVQQAQQMQNAAAGAAEDLRAVEATGYAADGRIAATVSGQGRMTALRIDPSVIDPDHPKTLAEQILAAVDSAHESVAQQRAALVEGVTGGLTDLVEGLHRLPPTAPGVLPQTPNRGRRPPAR
jgi:nucleoid-associated protein EbfC